MILVKIFFALLIVICAVFYVLYIWDFSLVLLIVISAIPVIMFFSLLIAKRSMRVEFAVNSKTASKNEPFDIQLCISNKSFIPIGKAEAIIEYYNVFNNQINEIELHFPIQARNCQRVTFQLSSKFCGMIHIQSAHVTIFDPLRIFKFKIGKNIKESIAIIPEGHDISGNVGYTSRINEESLMFSEHHPGDDPSEVFDLREYYVGDKLNRIHWKLSSKNDKFIVKDYSLPIDSPVIVFLDLFCLEDSEYTLPIFDTLAEALVSVSQLLLENERLHTIVYYNANKKCFDEKNITDISSLAVAISELIFSIDDNLYSASPDVFFAENNHNNLASFTFITSQNDLSLFSYIDEEIDANIKNAVVVVKDNVQSEKICYGFSSLNTVPVTIGRISSSIRDIEL